jgi:hypothetical protein
MSEARGVLIRSADLYVDMPVPGMDVMILKVIGVAILIGPCRGTCDVVLGQIIDICRQHPRDLLSDRRCQALLGD